MIKLNGIAKWIIVALALGTVAFNSGVTYNHVRHLSKDLAKLELKVEEMHEALHKINIQLAKE
jgi:hypothetical protein